MSEILGMKQGTLNGNYLGLPLLIGRSKREIMGFIREKVLGKIRSWNNRFLSREIILKNVVQAIPTFAMSVFLIPLEMRKEIKKIMNGYWWGRGAVRGTKLMGLDGNLRMLFVSRQGGEG